MTKIPIILFLLLLSSISKGQNPKPHMFSNGKYEFVFFDKALYDSTILLFNKFEKGDYKTLLPSLNQMTNDLTSLTVDSTDEYIKFISQFDTDYDLFLMTDTLERQDAISFLNEAISKIQSGKIKDEKDNIFRIKNLYLFWKCSPGFYQKYFYKAPLVSLDLSTDFWNYLYHNYDVFASIIRSEVDPEDETIFTIYPDQPINNIPSSHAKTLYEKLQKDSSLVKFLPKEVALFMTMLVKTANKEWISYEFDWD